MGGAKFRVELVRQDIFHVSPTALVTRALFQAGRPSGSAPQPASLAFPG